MQQAIASKDAELISMRMHCEEAVRVEKARWAATFNALVSSVREPFQSLQEVIMQGCLCFYVSHRVR